MKDENLNVAAGWVEKAESDLKNAAHTLRLGDQCPTDTVAFHAQQCVEKYLKALFVFSDTDFPRTHSIAVLWRLLQAPDRPELTAEEQERLTDYATVTRYPGDYEPIPLDETRWAVRVARRVRGQARKLLPAEVIRLSRRR